MKKQLNMNFRTRLIMLVTGMLVGAVLVTTVLLGWSTRQAVLSEAEATGEMVARLLARSASLAREIPSDVEQVIGDQMVAQATILAHFVGAAEQAGLSPEEINERLRRIVDQTILDELWITDERGYAYLHNIEFVEFTFSSDPNEQPQAHRFWPLLVGDKKVVVQEAMKREIDERVFKYVGVTGIDKPRIVEVGYEADYLNNLANRIGLRRVVDNLLGGGDINALWVLNETLDTIVEPDVERIVAGKAGGPFELVDDRMKRAVDVVGRTLIAQPDMVLRRHAVAEHLGDPRLADAGLARQ